MRWEKRKGERREANLCQDVLYCIYVSKHDASPEVVSEVLELGCCGLHILLLLFSLPSPPALPSSLPPFTYSFSGNSVTIAAEEGLASVDRI